MTTPTDLSHTKTACTVAANHILLRFEALLAKQVAGAQHTQDNYSRADEFLWFRRKLDEYMWKSTSPSYQAFRSNFVEPNATKYLAEIDKRKAK